MGIFRHKIRDRGVYFFDFGYPLGLSYYIAKFNSQQGHFCQVRLPKNVLENFRWFIFQEEHIGIFIFILTVLNWHVFIKNNAYCISWAYICQDIQ